MERMTFGEELFYKKQRGGIGADTVLLAFLVVILVLLVVLVSFTSLCLVDGHSMDDTLEDGQYVLLNKSQTAEPGDIIVFTKDKNYIKRVIAVGGETIRFVSENGGLVTQKLTDEGFKTLDESFIKNGYMSSAHNIYPINEDINIPENKYFVMGDNRENSDDSRGRNVGLVDKSEVMGKVIYRLKIGSMDEWLLKLLFSSGIRGS